MGDGGERPAVARLTGAADFDGIPHNRAHGLLPHRLHEPVGRSRST